MMLRDSWLDVVAYIRYLTDRSLNQPKSTWFCCLWVRENLWRSYTTLQQWGSWPKISMSCSIFQLKKYETNKTEGYHPYKKWVIFRYHGIHPYKKDSSKMVQKRGPAPVKPRPKPLGMMPAWLGHRKKQIGCWWLMLLVVMIMIMTVIVILIVTIMTTACDLTFQPGLCSLSYAGKTAEISSLLKTCSPE